MELKMTVEEREEFLAGVHVGVMAVERADGPPLSVPIWYGYSPGGEVSVVMGTGSLKHRLLESAQRFSLCVQEENLPYKYVSVEGPVAGTSVATTEDSRVLAHRYMGAEFGDLYVESTSSEASTRVTMAPERWFTLDYSKMA